MARFLKQSFAQTCLKERTMVNCINLIIEMSPRFVPGRENVPCVAELVNRSLKADCTDFTKNLTTFQEFQNVCQCIYMLSLKSLHFILAQSGNSIIATAGPLKPSLKEHN